MNHEGHEGSPRKPGNRILRDISCHWAVSVKLTQMPIVARLDHIVFIRKEKR
jgi:hypothetical protein